MTNLQSLDNNISNFEEIVKKLSNFSDVTSFLSKNKEAIEKSIIDIENFQKLLNNNIKDSQKELNKGLGDISSLTKENGELILNNIITIKDNLTVDIENFQKQINSFNKDVKNILKENENKLEDLINSKLSTHKSEIKAAIRDGGNDTGIRLENVFNKKNFTLIILVIIIILLNSATLLYLIIKDLK